MNSKVSVIIPVYKTERYLLRCTDSIRRQDYDNLEIILVDDGSPDDSGNICDRISECDSRVRVVHKDNGGLSSARNAGLDLATGEYICFVDSDDYVARDYISTLYGLITTHNADLSKINYAEVHSDYFDSINRKAKEVVFEGEKVEEAFLDLRVDSACVFMYKRQLIGESRFPIGKTSEDIPFNFEIFQKAKKLAYMPISKYYYFHNPESISNGPLDKNMFNYLYFRRDIYIHYKQNPNNALLFKSEALYARAAMGLMARMALFGITPQLSERESRKLLKKVFTDHAKAFYKDKNVEKSRKALAVLVFYCYPMAKVIGKVL